MLRLVLLAAALGLAARAQAQSVTVFADRQEQRFDGAGVSFGLYLGHHYSLPAAGQDEAVRLIAQGLSLTYLQDYPDRYPADDPDYFSRRIQYLKAARVYRPGIQMSLVGNKFPDALRTTITVNNKQYRVLDVSDPLIYDRLAAWYFAMVQAYADQGETVEILNVVNEPDLNVCANVCRPYEYGYGNDTKRAVAEIFAQAVPRFKALFADPAVNTRGLRVPRIMGPSAFSPDGALAYIRYFKTERPDAWAQIDVVSTHQYSNGARGDLMEAIRTEADGRAFIQSETHAAKTNNATDNLGGLPIDEQHRTMLSLARIFGAAINKGVDSWWYFETNYPGPFDPPGLLATPFNGAGPTPYRHYFTFRQITSTQPDSSFVVETTNTTSFRANAWAFRPAGRDTIFVTYTNTTGATQNVSFDVQTATGARPLTRYALHVSDATRSDAVVEDVAIPAGTTALTLPLGPYSVNTLVLAYDGMTTAGEGGPDAPALRIASAAPNPTSGTTRIGYSLATPGRARLEAFNVLGQSVVLLADGETGAGEHVALFDASGLASGVYVVRLTSGGDVATRRVVVRR